MRSLAWAVRFILVAASLVAACGGDATVRDIDLDGGAASDAAALDAGARDGGGGGSALCPRDPPADGARCAATGARCEYGDDPDPQCNAARECSASGAWTARAPGGACPTPSAASVAGCPATYALARARGACAALGARCGYPEGRCACMQDAADGGAARRWVCDAPALASCPLPRPRLGASCDRDGLLCNYAACVLDGGVQLVCQEGVWRLSSFTCGG